MAIGYDRRFQRRQVQIHSHPVEAETKDQIN